MYLESINVKFYDCSGLLKGKRASHELAECGRLGRASVGDNSRIINVKY